MNPWLYVFLISVLIFFLVVDWRSLRENLWAGLLCMVHYLVMSPLQDKINMMKYLRVNEGLPDIPIFANQINIFHAGIGFTMGILFVQLLPKNFYLQFIHAGVWIASFQTMIFLSGQNHMIAFIHWRPLLLFWIIPTQTLALTWLKNNSTAWKRERELESAGKYTGQ